MSWKVCSTPGCAELVDREHPCSEHGRPLNARWSRDRDGAEHNRWARTAKKAHPYCSVCGATKKLDAHHGPDGEAVVLCNPCHVATDRHARAR
jgi:hypothetical protein